jgi:NitT/TauT family transport system substrate-binding protein
MKRIMPVLAIGILFVLVSCGNSYEENRRLSRAEKERLDSLDQIAFKVGVMPTLDCLPVYIAYEDSLFEKDSVRVHLKSFTAQMDCDTALTKGSVQGSVTDLVRVERLRSRGVALTYPIATNTYWQLVTNRLARIRELHQLSDKMIADTRFSATDLLTGIAIRRGHPKYNVYRVQINDVKIRLEMLENNEMDAMFLTEPQATKARLMGSPVLLDSRDLDMHLGVFAFRKADLAGRRRQMRLFLKAYNQAVDSIHRHGLQFYGPLIRKYCGSDPQTVKALPSLVFTPAHSPRRQDIERARKWIIQH